MISDYDDGVMFLFGVVASSLDFFLAVPGKFGG